MIERRFLEELVPGYRDPADSVFAIHLQWFAAEDEGRTEDPTEQKIKKAREEGKVAKSADLSGAVVLLLATITVGILGRYWLRTMSEMLTFFLSRSTSVDVVSDATVVPAVMSFFLRMTLPVAAVAFVAAFAGNVLQVGFLFTVKPITPDLNKIVPKFGKFFKRAFFSGESIFNLFKSIFKVVVVGLISFLNIRAHMGELVTTITQPFMVSFKLVVGIAFMILVESAIFLLVLSVADYVFQRRQHKESLKMSKQEIKEERKMMDGDPLVRRRLQERMRDLLNQSMLQNVPKADVVVTNPTHYSVAIEYRQREMAAPTVTAKGQDHMAQRIREIARANDVPLIENKPFARALYAELDVGDEIPEKFYEVTAVILKQVYEIKGRRMEAS